MSFAKIPVVVAAVSVLGLTACQPPVEGQGTRNSQIGALTGAAVGLAVGAASGANATESIRNAALGAAVLGTVGALAGNTMDQQEAELRNEMGAGVGIVNTGTSLIVTMPQDILFATGSATLTPTLQGDLRDVAANLNRYPNSTITVLGHTDNTGTAEYNLDLSQRRAQAVASVLISSGVAANRIRVTGMGENQPIATNQTAEGRAQNRRVEIVITPTQ
ncbi:MAG: OmpA family protein [Rhodobacterales bacterium]|nr:OmpA family protein [Rhodobacterales bacterium]